MARRAAQLSLPRTSGWGGKRKGAGRKPAGDRAGVPHRARPQHYGGHPVHATLRASPSLPSLREQPLFLAIQGAIRAASCPAFRIVHFSVQSDHLHLLLEASDRSALMSGLRGLAIRTARAVNRALCTHGRVWADRYHARPLPTPREVRNALLYVLQNWAKRAFETVSLDSRSSACWFDGWKGPRPGWALPPEGERPPVWAPRTWLLTAGWRRLGLISLAERPRGGSGPRPGGPGARRLDRERR